MGKGQPPKPHSGGMPEPASSSTASCTRPGGNSFEALAPSFLMSSTLLIKLPRPVLSLFSAAWYASAVALTSRFLEWFQRGFGFTPTNALIGALNMAFMVSYMVTAPIFGRLAESTSRWLLIGVGVVLWSLATGASGLAASFGMLLLTRSFLMRDPARGQAALAQGAAPRKVIWRDYFVLARTPSYVLNTLGMSAMTFAMGGLGFWMPDYVSNYRKVPGSSVTTFGAILVVAGLGSTLLGGMAGDKLRSRFPGSYFLVSGAAMVAGFPLFLTVLYVPFPLAWVFIFLALVCLFFNTGPANTILANVTHPAIRASAFALNILVIHSLGDVISPLIIGLISDYLAVPKHVPLSPPSNSLGTR